MAVYDPRHRRQTYPGPLELVRPVQPLEGPEELVLVGLVEARPVIRDVVNAARDAETDGGPRLPGGELPGVTEQVFERHLEQPDVAPGRDTLLDLEIHLPVRIHPPKVVRDAKDDRAQVDALAPERPPANPGEVQQIVY